MKTSPKLARTIFLQQFKYSWFQKLAIVVPAMLLLIAVEKIVEARPGLVAASRDTLGGTPDVVVNTFLAMMIVLSAFASGIRTFARMNEHHIAFVHSLPVPRTRLWSLTVSANLGAVLLTIPVVLGLRPSLFPGVTDSKVMLVAFAYLVLFAAGLCFTMLAQRTIVAGGIGAPIVIAGIMLSTDYSALMAAEFPYLYPRPWGVPFSSALDEPFLMFALSIMILLFLALSLSFFAHGELTLMTTRVKNWVMVAAASFFFCLSLCLVITSGVFALNDTWVTRRHLPSPDGKHVAIVDVRERHQLFGRVHIVDTHTGVRSGPYETYGLAAAIWSGGKPVLNLLALQSPLSRLAYILPRSDYVIRLSPTAEVVSKVTLGATIMDASSEPAGAILMMLVDGGNARLIAMEDGGSIRELLKTPLKDQAALQRTSSGTLAAVFLPVSGGNSILDKAWLVVQSKVSELPWSAREKGRTSADFLLPDGLASYQSTETTLAEDFPMPAAAKALGYSEPVMSYLVPYRLSYDSFHRLSFRIGIRSIAQVFGTVSDPISGRATLFAADPKSRQWERLGETHFLNRFERKDVAGSSILRSVGGIQVDSENRLATFVVRQRREIQTFLYDGQTNQKLLLATQPDTEDPMRFTEILHTAETGNFLLTYFQDTKIFSFLYHRGNAIKKLELPAYDVRWVNTDGSLIYVTRGNEVMYRSFDGLERKLWPQ